MTHYEIFKACFLQFSFDEETFLRLCGAKSGRFFDHTENGEAVGFALVVGCDLRLICVLPQYSGKGIGSRLFKAAEEYIFSNGHSRINIGGCGSELFIGAVPESVPFFEKHGCTFGNLIAEMGGETKRLNPPPHTPPENASFGFYSGNQDSLKEAVAKVDEDWVQYFCGGDVFCGYEDGKTASFCLLDSDVECLLSDGKGRIGSIGCVGTVPDFRKKGIGLEMVYLAAKELEKHGCERIFIHYTAVYDWYARLGFSTFLWVRIGGKDFTENV